MQNNDNKDYSGLEELLLAETMEKYNNFIVSTAIQNANETNQVVDFGAGIGTLSMIFRERYQVNPLCVEIDELNKEYLAKRNFSFFDSLESISNNSDFIFSSNVLEHIEDDLSILKSMKNNLNQSGKIYLYLPAKMMLWSELDQMVGHFRRYEPSEIRFKCEQVGLKVIKVHYADCLGFFASLLMRLIGYDAKNGIGSIGSLKFYDRWLFPISAFLDKIGCKFLFGKNLILVAQKID